MMQVPLLLIPGLVNDASAWAPQADALGEIAQIRVAEHGPCDSLVDLAKNALQLIPGPMAIAGHSMGGRIAMEAFRLEPHRILGLALLDTAYRPLATGDAGEQEIARRYAFLDLARRDGMRAMVVEWVKGMVHPSRLGDPSLINAILDMMSRSPVEQFARQIHALINRPDATPLLPTIDRPTLVLCGREDSWATAKSHEEMAKLIPRSRLVILPTCGHMATLEKPAAVSAAMREWLMDIQQGSALTNAHR